MNVKLDTFIALPLCEHEQPNSCSTNITPYNKLQANIGEDVVGKIKSPAPIRNSTPFIQPTVLPPYKK